MTQYSIRGNLFPFYDKTTIHLLPNLPRPIAGDWLIMKKSNKFRQLAFTAQRRYEGYKEISVWINPDNVKTLEAIKSYNKLDMTKTINLLIKAFAV